MEMKSKKKLPLELFRVIASIASAWLIMTSIALTIFPQAGSSVKFETNVNTIMYLVLVLMLSVPIIVVDAIKPKLNISSHTFMISLVSFIFLCVVKLADMVTYTALIIVLFIAFYCYEVKYKPRLIHFPIKKQTTVITAIAVVTVIVTAIACSTAILRYITYSTPNYDFGIFCNMFYNMKKSGQPLSTCERDRLLSHFAVHVSPIYYLILPIYYIFSSPITLGVLQSIIIFSALIPIYLLCRHYKIESNAAVFICAAFALFTPLSTGCFYDLHENCFLVPLLLWLFYFFEKDKLIPMSVFLLLTLMVKEDAFIYIAFFSAYAIINRKKYLRGSLMLAFSGVYFLFVSYLLSKYGLGIMSSRYDSISSDGSLMSAAKTIIVNPGFAISQVLKTEKGTTDKVFYLIQIFAPLGFLPFFSKDFSRYILIFPIFINLLTKYGYQYNITFQYTFGICAFLIYLSIINLSEKEKRQQTNHSFVALTASAMLFCMIVVPKLYGYIDSYNQNKEEYKAMTQALEIIPDEASVTASTYILPHLASRDIIYEDEYHEGVDTEYFVLDLRYKVSEGRAQKYIDAGYELVGSVEGKLEIYQKK